MARLYLNGSPKTIGYGFDKEKSKNAYTRYILVQKLIDENQDSNGKLFLEDVVKKAVSYIECVVDFETRCVMLKTRLDPSSSEYSMAFYRLDRTRKEKHDLLINSLSNFNIYLGREYKFMPEGIMPIGGIYSEDYSQIASDYFSSESRRKIGDWAWYLVSGVYEVIEK